MFVAVNLNEEQKKRYVPYISFYIDRIYDYFVEVELKRLNELLLTSAIS